MHISMQVLIITRTMVTASYMQVVYAYKPTIQLVHINVEFICFDSIRFVDGFDNFLVKELCNILQLKSELYYFPNIH